MNKKAKQPTALLTLALLPFLFTGCLKCDILLELSPDGSGSIESTYSVSENAIAQLNAMVKLGKQLDEISGDQSREALKDPEIMLFLNADKDKIRARLAPYEKNGLVLDKLRVRSRNAWRTVDIRLEFDDIAKLAKADFFKDIGFEFYRRQSGNYVLKRPSMNADNPNNETVNNADARRLMAPVLEGFEMTVKVHTPGRVLESTAPGGGAGLSSAATWVFDLEKDPKAFQKLQDQEFIILIDGTGVNIPDIKLDKKDSSAK